MITGYIDSVKCGVVDGWAWDPDEPSKHVKVEVSADTGHSQVFVASAFRKDLLDARMGEGDHSFSFRIPTEWLTRVPTGLTFRFVETGQVLPGGTVAVTPRLPVTVTDNQESFASACAAIAGDDGPELTTRVVVNAAYSVTLKTRDVQSRVLAKIAIAAPLDIVDASGRTRADKRVRFREIGRQGELRILEATFKLVAKPKETAQAETGSIVAPFPIGRKIATITLTFSAEAPDSFASAAEPDVSWDFVSTVLIRMVAPELASPFETGAASADNPQGSFSTTAFIKNDGPGKSTPTRAPRIAVMAGRELTGALARCAHVQQLAMGPEDDLWHTRFDLVLLQISWLHTWMIRDADARESLACWLESCAQLEIPLIVYLDAPDNGVLGGTGLATDIAFALYEQPQFRLPGSLTARHELLVAPLIDTGRYNPFGRRDWRAPLSDFAGNGLYVADGWWDLCRAAWEVTDNIEPILPRLVVMDSRYDVSTFRVQKDPMFRWNTVGAVDENTKVDILKRCSFLIFTDSSGAPGSNLQRDMSEAKACGCLPIILTDENSGRSTPETNLGAVQVGELDSIAGFEKDLLIYRSAMETLRTSDPAPLLSRITRTLYPNREFSYKAAKPHISVITVSMRPWNIKAVLANFKRQHYEDKQHIVIIHGQFSAEEQESVTAAVSREERTIVYFCPPQITLGECLNYGVKRASGQFIAKFDDDDYYTEDYLSDAMFLIETVGSSMYTQPPGLVYLAASQSLIRYRPGVKSSFATHDANSYCGFTGAGGTLILDRELVDRIAFTESRRGGIDSDFVGRAVAAGETLHVGGYFNYVFFRGADKAGHTWRKGDEEFTADADVLASGRSLPECLMEVGLTMGPQRHQPFHSPFPVPAPSLPAQEKYAGLRELRIATER